MSDFGNYGLGEQLPELQDVVDPGPIGDPDSAAEEEEEQIANGGDDDAGGDATEDRAEADDDAPQRVISEWTVGNAKIRVTGSATLWGAKTPPPRLNYRDAVNVADLAVIRRSFKEVKCVSAAIATQAYMNVTANKGTTDASGVANFVAGEVLGIFDTMLEGYSVFDLEVARDPLVEEHLHYQATKHLPLWAYTLSSAPQQRREGGNVMWTVKLKSPESWTRMGRDAFNKLRGPFAAKCREELTTNGTVPSGKNHEDVARAIAEAVGTGKKNKPPIEFGAYLLFGWYAKAKYSEQPHPALAMTGEEARQAAVGRTAHRENLRHEAAEDATARATSSSSAATSTPRVSSAASTSAPSTVPGAQRRGSEGGAATEAVLSLTRTLQESRSSTEKSVGDLTRVMAWKAQMESMHGQVLSTLKRAELERDEVKRAKLLEKVDKLELDLDEMRRSATQEALPPSPPPPPPPPSAPSAPVPAPTPPSSSRPHVPAALTTRSPSPTSLVPSASSSVRTTDPRLVPLASSRVSATEPRLVQSASSRVGVAEPRLVPSAFPGVGVAEPRPGSGAGASGTQAPRAAPRPGESVAARVDGGTAPGQTTQSAQTTPVSGATSGQLATALRHMTRHATGAAKNGKR